MVIAVIPARGGSKRIPLKNIKEFADKPIIAWSIEAALRSQLFDRIIVSTDHQGIAEVALRYGAEVPFSRPEELADDFTDTQTVVKHAVEWLNRKGAAVEYACCIYATAPFIKAADLKVGYERLLNSEKAFAFSVTTFPFPVQRAIKIDEMGHVAPLWPEDIKRRSQDLEEAFHDAGQFYWGTAESFLQKIPLFSKNSIPVIIPRHRVQDIDTPEDWKRAEMMYQVAVSMGDIKK